MSVRPRKALEGATIGFGAAVELRDGHVIDGPTSRKIAFR
jgi:hypothetical protein